MSLDNVLPMSLDSFVTYVLDPYTLDLADFGAEQPLYLGTRNDPPSNQNQKRPGEQSWHLQIPEF